MTRESSVQYSLGPSEALVQSTVRRWTEENVAARLWSADPTLWPEAPPAEVPDRTGWLALPAAMTPEVPGLARFAQAVRTEGLRHVVLLGMGGSSLAPDVFRRMLGAQPGFPSLLVLDSTHPDAVRSTAAAVDLARTLFVVSSKSGTTTEPLDFHRYFAAELTSEGIAPPGPQFVAVTDPGSPLEGLARSDGFRAVFRAVSTVGGRYSALTMFGLVPAALLGLDLGRLLRSAQGMAADCGPNRPAGENPGLRLGATIGTLARAGRDKLTFYATPEWGAFPVWVEQLVAESTGKLGRGIVPIVDEPLVDPTTYGADRQFVALLESEETDPALARHLEALESLGHPVVRIPAPAPPDVGAEFLRWEIAVALAGRVLAIDPFDQPDVELAKELARRAMADRRHGPSAPEELGISTEDGPGFRSAVRAHLDSARPGDYLAVQAYLAPTNLTRDALSTLRSAVLGRTRLATTVGFGPRFLHSTGQLHKGGPNSGVFLQLVDTPRQDVAVPGAGYTFGELIAAQSLGDLRALRQKGRRVLRIDLGKDVTGGIVRLVRAVRG